MTPLAIEIALFYHTRCGDYGEGYPENNHRTVAVQEVLALFVSNGLLEKNPQNHAQRYLPTDGLRCFVEAICSITLPVMRWEIPG